MPPALNNNLKVLPYWCFSQTGLVAKRAHRYRFLVNWLTKYCLTLQAYATTRMTMQVLDGGWRAELGGVRLRASAVFTAQQLEILNRSLSCSLPQQ